MTNSTIPQPQNTIKQTIWVDKKYPLPIISNRQGVGKKINKKLKISKNQVTNKKQKNLLFYN